jgi:succinoglycan biosynthesis protein ExoV
LIHYNSPVPNFGDDLNVDLWPALAPDLFNEDDGAAFVGIGTIIGMDVGPERELHVFSSGAGYDPLSNWAGKQVEFHCVRGPLSAQLLKLRPEKALTDGAILTPLVSRFPQGRGEKAGVVVIPHYQTLAFPGWEKVTQETGFTLVDPRDTPLSVVQQIASSELVLTESLHGAIIADTYGVPWLAFATSRNFSMSKWVDWTASVGLDLDVMLVPPPDGRPLLAFGRPAEPFGSTVRMGIEDAARAFSERVTHKNGGNWLKKRIKQLPMVHSLMGYSPSRTAEMLAKLAGMPPKLSDEAIRTRLQCRMMELLERMKTVALS